MSAILRISYPIKSLEHYDEMRHEIVTARNLVCSAADNKFCFKRRSNQSLLHTKYKISVKTQKFITYSYFRATCFDSFESSSGPSRNRSKFINVYGAFWDPERVRDPRMHCKIDKLGSVS